MLLAKTKKKYSIACQIHWMYEDLVLFWSEESKGRQIVLLIEIKFNLTFLWHVEIVRLNTWEAVGADANCKSGVWKLLERGNHSNRFFTIHLRCAIEKHPGKSGTHIHWCLIAFLIYSSLSLNSYGLVFLSSDKV